MEMGTVMRTYGGARPTGWRLSRESAGLDGVIQRRGPEIEALLAEFGVPVVR